jgi:CubicO group peptidase (beta-lactamase class C family)
MKTLRRILAALLLLLIAVAVYLWLKPPALLRVGANYSAKIVCSNVFLAGRDPDEVLKLDVQAPGIALLRLMHVSVDRERGVVRTGLLGFIGDGLAEYRPGKGCTVVPDGKLDAAAPTAAAPGTSDTPATAAAAAASATAATRAPATATRGPPVLLRPSGDASAAVTPWPDGTAVRLNSDIERVLNDDALAGPGARAIIVVDHGRIVGERYAKGFDADTPLLGWSMTKTVTASVIGMLIKDGKLSLDQAGFWPGATDGREKIHLSDLLAMSSGLQWNEAYGAVSDVTGMLYLQPDMAAYARAQPLAHPVGEVWSYSSGTAVILARIAQEAAGEDIAAYTNARLFNPLGITSATIEQDGHGTPVGSSYMYATARDWARFGQFLLQDGIWQGQELLPYGYVSMMATPVAASSGQYGKGQVWLWGSDAATPGVNPDTAFGIPGDTFWMSGHDGQNVAVIKSRQLVIVRLGLTPYVVGYSPQPLVKAILGALPFH